MVLPVIIAGQVILHGIRIVGLRVIPYIVREGTRIAAKQATKQAVKKVGTKKITESGFVIITKDPTKFKLAQKIFGKNKVFRNENILQAQSTASKEIVPITQKILKSASPEVRTTILNQADDAANGVSKFISSSKVQTVGGTKITKPFTDFFGKNLKFSKNTTEAIKLAEQGPASLSKEIVATKVATETTKKIPEVIRLKHTVAPTVRTGKEVAKVIEETVKPPWYVAVMPKFLRTSTVKQITTKGGAPIYPTIQRTTQALKYPKTTKAVVGAATVAPFLPYPERTPKQPHKDIDLDMNELFGGATQGYEQLDITSGIDFYDEDETGNIIQAQ